MPEKQDKDVVIQQQEADVLAPFRTREVDLINPFTNGRLEMRGTGLFENNQLVFPYVRGAYRVVQDEENYTGKFGFQWNKFQTTQIDRENENSDISRQRFFAQTQWDK